jgi:hypothetical protein
MSETFKLSSILSSRGFLVGQLVLVLILFGVYYLQPKQSLSTKPVAKTQTPKGLEQLRSAAENANVPLASKSSPSSPTIGRRYTRMDAESLVAFPPAFKDPEYVAMFRQVYKEMLAVEIAPMLRLLNLRDDAKNAIILESMVDKLIAQNDCYSITGKSALYGEEKAMLVAKVEEDVDAEFRLKIGNDVADFIKDYQLTPRETCALVNDIQAGLTSSASPLSADQEREIFNVLFEAKRMEPKEFADFCNRKDGTWFIQKLVRILNGQQLDSARLLVGQYLNARINSAPNARQSLGEQH